MKDFWIQLCAGIAIFAVTLGLSAATNITSAWLKAAVAFIAGGIAWLVAWRITKAGHKEQPVSVHDKVTERGRSTIEVFLPDWSEQKDGDFYQDGAIQYKGFKHAEREAVRTPDILSVGYNEVFEHSTPDQIIEEMKGYYDKGTRYFIMTMSTKVEDILGRFKKWHEECVGEAECGEQNAPILIVTVASAPGLADINAGIVRWYIRSEEESKDLANHLDSRRTKEAATFAITETDGIAHSTYGTKSVEIFIKNFDGPVPTDLRFYVTARTARQAVQTFFSKCRQNDEVTPDHEAKAWPGVFIVGYGNMIKNTVTALIEGGYAGYIACTSTLTDPQWRPPIDVLNTSKAEIFTVLPQLNSAVHPLPVGEDRNVVFFFAKKTLLRVLKLTAGNTDSKAFLEKWRSGSEEGPQELDQKHLVEGGDIEVNLKVVDARKL